LYEAERGQPALRARHLEWKIGAAERDRWLEHMSAALEASQAGALERAQLLSHFRSVAQHLVNTGPEVNAGEEASS
jgi:hemoglobin